MFCAKRFFLSGPIAPNFCQFFSTAIVPPYREEKVKVSDVEINVIQSSDNEPNAHPIFVLPGTLGSIEMDFKPILEECNTRKYKWICWDPPGYGKSRPPNRVFMSDRYDNVYEHDAVYIKMLLGMWGYPKYTLVAWSGAALTAMVVAAEQPDKVSGLITWGGFGCIEEDMMSQLKAMKERGLSKIGEPRRSQLLTMYGEALLQEMWNGWSDGINHMGNTERFQNGGSFQRVIHQVSCPALIIHGAKDNLVNGGYAQHLKNNLKNSRLLIMENGTHNLHLRQTKPFIENIQNFVDQVSLQDPS